jgi:hypothetical protein
VDSESMLLDPGVGLSDDQVIYVENVPMAYDVADNQQVSIFVEKNYLDQKPVDLKNSLGQKSVVIGSLNCNIDPCNIDPCNIDPCNIDPFKKYLLIVHVV